MCRPSAPCDRKPDHPPGIRVPKARPPARRVGQRCAGRRRRGHAGEADGAGGDLSGLDGLHAARWLSWKDLDIVLATWQINRYSAVPDCWAGAQRAGGRASRGRWGAAPTARHALRLRRELRPECDAWLYVFSWTVVLPATLCTPRPLANIKRRESRRIKVGRIWPRHRFRTNIFQKPSLCCGAIATASGSKTPGGSTPSTTAY